MYDGTCRAENRAGAGVAFAYVDQLRVLGKSASDPVLYTYNDEPEPLHVTHSGDWANRVLVFGPLSASAAYSDNWDWADVDATGQERAAIAVEPQTSTAAEAQLRGALELVREQRFALAVQMSVQPNPELELHDVVQIDYAAIGPAVCRVTELHMVYCPGQGQHDLVIVAGGV